MRVYFAAFAFQKTYGLQKHAKHVLETYVSAQGDTKKFFGLISELRDDGGTFFLDSGAFSAWTRGASIDVLEYADFCIKHEKMLDIIACLDVIPGRPGSNPTSRDVQEAAEQGWANYQKMLDRGVNPQKLLHVYHQGETPEWLDRIADTGHYIGVSPANDKSSTERMRWLDMCVQRICDNEGYPTVKFHGFGATAVGIINRYPWWSVDSTSWCKIAAFGAIMVPRKTDGAYDFTATPISVFFSDRSPTLREKSKHYDTMTPVEQEHVRIYVEEQEMDLQKLRERCEVRAFINIKYMKKVEAAARDWPWSYSPPAQGAFL